MDQGNVPIKYQIHTARSFHRVMFAYLSRLFARQADTVVGTNDYITNELKHRLGCRNVVKIPSDIDIKRLIRSSKEEYLKLIN